MELYTEQRVCIANITGRMNTSDTDDGFLDLEDESREVFFTVSKLPSDEQFQIVYYASNMKGKSGVKHFKVNTLPIVSGEKGKTRYSIIKLVLQFVL